MVGFGNVGQHLCSALQAHPQVCLQQIYNHTLKPVPASLNQVTFITDINKLAPVDLCIIAVPDGVITTITNKIVLENTLIVHTSGGIAMDAIKGTTRKGVFYPLQSFSKMKEVDFKNIPFLIEATNEKDAEILKTVAGYLSNKVSEIDSKQRAIVHVAAVFANNFVNAMYQISEQIVEEHDIDFNLLKPLILETALKIKEASPQHVQTGPAVRNDITTIKKHQDSLTNPEFKEIYNLITSFLLKQKNIKDE